MRIPAQAWRASREATSGTILRCLEEKKEKKGDAIPRLNLIMILPLIATPCALVQL